MTGCTTFGTGPMFITSCVGRVNGVDTHYGLTIVAPERVHFQGCFLWSSNASRAVTQSRLANGFGETDGCCPQASPIRRVGWTQQALAVSRSWRRPVWNP